MKTARIDIRIDAKTKKLLERAAKRDNISLSEYLIAAALAYTLKQMLEKKR